MASSAFFSATRSGGYELLKASAKSRVQPAERLGTAELVENDDDRDRYEGEGGREGGR